MPDVATLVKMRDAAKEASHPFPEYAACETALETATPDKGWFQSQLFLQGNNCFGQKQRAKLPPLGAGTLSLPTWEVISGKTVNQIAHWVRFATTSDSFKQRLDTLNTLLSIYYNAVRAKTGEEFIREVSAKWNKIDAPADNKKVFAFSDGNYQFVTGRWSTDPARALKVLETYNAHKDAFGEVASQPEATLAPEAAAVVTPEPAKPEASAEPAP